MIVVAYEFIELINTRFGSFHIVVLGSKIFGKGGLKERFWNSLAEIIITNHTLKGLWEILL